MCEGIDLWLCCHDCYLDSFILLLDATRKGNVLTNTYYCNHSALSPEKCLDSDSIKRTENQGLGPGDFFSLHFILFERLVPDTGNFAHMEEK